MKATIFFCFVVFAFYAATADLQCEHRKPVVPNDWLDMVPPCITKMRRQVQRELDASLQYLAMGAYFSRDVVNRPGFAKMFFEAASEEREHAIKFISYLIMRGELTSNVSKLIKRKNPPKEKWESGVDALRDSLRLEASVTKSIQDIIKTCESPGVDAGKDFNDYHLVDYLTGEFLEEQYKGQRDLAGKISIIDKMSDTHGVLGEWLFDQKLQKGEL